MKLILLIITNFKNLLPYFLLIGLYFLFINLETRKENIQNRIIDIENQLIENKSSRDDKQQVRIIIPVIPYKQQVLPNN